MLDREDLYELVDLSKLAIRTKKSYEEVKTMGDNKFSIKGLVIFAAVIAAIGGVVYAIYNYFKKDYDDEFMDDFDDFDEDDDEIFDEDLDS